MTPRLRLSLVFAVALSVRVAAALVLGIDGPARGDERGYALLAQSLAAGDGFVLPLPDDLVAALGLSDHPGLRAFRAPLLPLLYAPLAAVGGGLTAMRVVSLFLGAACAPVLLLASRRLVPQRDAFRAALAYAVWPPLVHLSTYALSEPLSMVLLLPAVALAADRERGRRGAMAAGVLAALSVLARPSMLLPALFLVPAAGSRRRAAALAAALALTLTPWLVRNAIVVGAPVLTTNSGVTLVGANCEASTWAEHPGKWHPPDSVYPSGPSAPDLGMWGWSELGEVGSNRRFTEDALAFAAQDPGRMVVLTGWKLVRLFDPNPRSSKSDAPWKALVGWGTVPAVLLLALMGAPGAWRRREQWAPWLAPLAGTVLTALVFYGDTRMRTAADPTLLLLAASGAAALLPDRAAGNSTDPRGSG